MAEPRPFFRLWHTVIARDSTNGTIPTNKPIRKRARGQIQILPRQSTKREEFLATVVVSASCAKRELRFSLVDRQTKKVVNGELRKLQRNPHLRHDELTERGVPEYYNRMCMTGVMAAYEFTLVASARALQRARVVEFRVRKHKIRMPSPPFIMPTKRSQEESPATTTATSDLEEIATEQGSTSSASSRSAAQPTRDDLLEEYTARAEDTKLLYEKVKSSESNVLVETQEPTRMLDWRNVIADASLLRAMTGFSAEQFNEICTIVRPALQITHKNAKFVIEDILLFISTYLRHNATVHKLSEQFQISKGACQRFISSYIPKIVNILEVHYAAYKYPNTFSGHYLVDVVFVKVRKAQSLLNEQFLTGTSIFDPVRNREGVKFVCTFDWEGHIQKMSPLYLGANPDEAILKGFVASTTDAHIFTTNCTSLIDASVTSCCCEGSCPITNDDFCEAVTKHQERITNLFTSWRCLAERLRTDPFLCSDHIRLCCTLQWYQTVERLPVSSS